MKWLDSHRTLYNHSCHSMPELADDSIQCCVTSPPYWGLRKYKGEQDLIWGGDKELRCTSCSAILAIGGTTHELRILREGNTKQEQQGTQEYLRESVFYSVGDTGREMAFTESAEQLGGEQHQLEGRNKTSPRVYYEESTPGLSGQSDSQGICNGASSSNGKNDREILDTRRIGTPYKCHTERQPARESSTGHKESTQRAGNMPLLPKDIRDKLACPVCHSKDLEDAECSHNWVDSSIPKSGVVGDYEVGRVGNAAARTSSHEAKVSNICSLCGAWRGAYGLEPSVDMYVQHTVEILREIRRVLRKDGVAFWNLGDSYATISGGMNQLAKMGKETPQYGAVPYANGYEGVPQKQKKGSGLKHKDLCLIPFRVAIAAQEDGWWVRSVIIWNKPNPMPESVTDRPTESHEYILMLTKSARYYWDMEAVREPQQESSIARAAYRIGGFPKGEDVGDSKVSYVNNPNTIEQTRLNAINRQGRNLRSVWTFPTQPFPGSHFATFPEKLPELCIKAATPEEGCCSKCGMPWERIVERHRMNRTELSKDDERYRPNTYNGEYGDINGKGDAGYTETKTLGWQPACKCNADKVPSIVLDPFCGSGTVLEVSAKLGRKAVGYEISEEYCKLIIERNNQGVL